MQGSQVLFLKRTLPWFKKNRERESAVSDFVIHR